MLAKSVVNRTSGFGHAAVDIRLLSILLIAVPLLFSSNALCDVYTRLEQVPQDSAYWLQGEYSGTVQQDGNEWVVGTQVATHGNDRYRLILYRGGLPGNGWDPTSQVRQLRTELDGKRLVFEDQVGRYVVQDGTLVLSSKSADRSHATGVLKRVDRQSPTLGLKPSSDALVLFDGTGVNEWRDGAEMTEDGLLNRGAVSRREFGDLYIHVEYFLPYWFQGQANSGIYIQNRYEVQILGSYGMWPVERHHDASLYNVRSPNIKATRPPLQWQSFDILFRAPRFDAQGNKTEHARISLYHNGILVHDNIELESGTGMGGQRPEVAKAELYLQRHTGPVFFRNVWVVQDAQDWPQTLRRALSHDGAADGEKPALKDVFKDYFLIGGAYNRRVVTGQDPQAAEIAIKHFNTATSENDMKWSLIHPQPGQFNWAPADRFMEFCEQHNMAPIGHTLVWHSQVPRWVFTDDSGDTLTREALLARMKDHITAVAGRYKGRMLGWDVVNEALNDNGTLRNSQWLRIIGEGKSEQKYDYIAKAFEYAHAVDPHAELYYNDYNLSTSRAKADGAAAIVRHLQSKGIRIDGVGMQMHAGLTWPKVEDLEYAIKTLSETGVKVMVTELDIRTRRYGPTGAEITQINRRTTHDPNAGSPEVQQRLADKYAEIFSILVKHKDVIPRVTFWGVYDATSWIGGSPLLFDSNYQPKQAFDAVVNVVRGQQ